MQDRNVIEELRRIENERGKLLPKDVVEAARSATSPLHPHFEWDDSEAAEKYRLDQARTLIRVCVEFVGNGGSKRRIQAFVSLSSDRHAGGGYRSLTQVMAMDDLRAQLLEDALADIDRFRAKYASVAELADVLKIMDATEAQIKAPTPKRRKRSA